MSQGYSLLLSEKNRSALQARYGEPENVRVGIELGAACLKYNVPVTEVAEHLKVSRQTVYNWFCGVCVPNKLLVPRIKVYLRTIR
ncbi:hypothetical protein UFOVP1288_31 [uncultured Caudovirales phage]|uniref:Uncharacterized protein n=1 Tax=uncultured Caudovirales phage TaxID=2100421 RepID=A0A6J5S7V7_9CAUD|nr:hypothetical protein UFOVP1195_31 [uncultured Caudovirales phage]CAB4195666.1 hypothetical protein UFOVP1288_31 [uncultured Caudovirales phage]CAB4204950.1 hypothetical protein UFOVP1409_31 [uncultured Caudovirales phage]